jgi:hypothetical protein
VKAVREAIEAVGARLLFLPPDSPDLNPIEPFFAKRKALLRTAARRTIDALCNAIASALDAFSPDQCRNPSPTPAIHTRRKTGPRSVNRQLPAVIRPAPSPAPRSRARRRFFVCVSDS